MRASTAAVVRPAVAVLGCDDVGSAIARALHGEGAAVVLIDDADPPWAPRGRSYTDAWYVGGATLDRVDACFCGSVRSLPAVLARGDMIAAERVEAGDVLGNLGDFACVAPIADVLTTLAARGARMMAGHALAEIDPHANPVRCFEIEPETRAIAHRVCAAVRRAAHGERKFPAASSGRDAIPA